MKTRAVEVMAWARRRPVAGATCALGAAVMLAFVAMQFIGKTSASSAFGVTAGILAALSLVAVMLYSWRRSRPQVRKLGPSRGYLEVHLWAGALFMLLLLVHTNFSLPVSAMGWLLWLLGAWVVVTGAIGTALQQTLPRFIVSTSTFEVNLERAPELVAQLRARAESLVAAAEQPLRAFHQRYMAPELAELTPAMPFLSRRPAISADADSAAAILARTLGPDGIATLDALREIRANKREIDAQAGVQRVMRGWLMFHLPVAVALLIVAALHVLFILYY